MTLVINMNKNQVIMDMKKYMKALPAVAALLLTAACSSDDFETIETPKPAKERIIHFTANVDNGVGTRATLDGNTYNFESGDKLYVWGENISGELTTTGFGTSAIFTGDLTYTGDDEPGVIDLHAVVKGPNDQVLGTFDEFKAREYVPSYTNGIASDKKDAVEKCSFLTDTQNNCNLSGANPSCFFELYQQSAFISFNITLEDGTAEGENITVTVNNGGSAVCSGSVKTVKVGDAIKAQFTAAFPGDETTLSGATVKLGDRDAISFASSNPTLYANKNYTVTKLYKRFTMTATATVPDIPMLSITGGEKTKTFKIEEFTYEKTLAELLSEYDESYAVIANYATCVRTSGENVSVSENKPYIFTVTGTGTSVFNVSIYGVSFPVTITVTE